MEYKQFYRRKLPHRHSPGATLFVTFRLAGSIPKSVLEQWKQEKIWLEKEGERLAKSGSVSQNQKDAFLDFHRRWFARFEEVLHKEESKIVWLKNTAVAKLISESLKYRDGKFYKLICFCIKHLSKSNTI